MQELPIFGAMSKRPILMSGMHGGRSPTDVTPAQVREVFRNNRGRPIPLIIGHQEMNDATPSMGEEYIEELVENYTDPNGNTHEVALLGSITKLNERGSHALGESEYLYYSPQMKRDATAGWVIEAEALTNIPRQQGLHPLQLSDMNNDRFTPGSIGRVSLSDHKEETNVGFTKEQMTQLSDTITKANEPLVKRLDELETKQDLADKAEPPVPEPAGEPTAPADDAVAKQLADVEKQNVANEKRLADSEKRLADSEARADAAEMAAKYSANLGEELVNLLVPINKAMRQVNSPMLLADGSKVLPNVLVTRLADHLVADRARMKEMGLTNLDLTDSPNPGAEGSYQKGRDDVAAFAN